jgi:hypothetical protein
MFKQLKIQDEDVMLSSISSNDANNGTDKGGWSDFKKTMKTGYDNYDFFPWCKPSEETKD